MYRAIKKKGLDLISICFILSIFTKEIFTIRVGGVDIDLFGYSFFALYFFYNLRVIIIYKPYKHLFFLIVISSILSILIYNYDYKLFIKAFFPIIIIYTAAFDIVYKRRAKLIIMFNFYLKVSFYVAIFGLIQWLLSLFGVNILIKQPGLLDSIAYEPSHYAVIILPSAVFYLKNLKNNLKESFVITLSLILTFSFTSYIILLITLLIPHFNFRGIIKLLLGISIMIFLSQYFPERVLERVVGLNQLYSGTSDFRDPTSNLTITSFESNFEVAKYSLKKNLFTGCGIGMHSYIYEEYFKYDSYFKGHPWYGINSSSAHSLTLRILSELGLLGFVFYVFFLYKSYFSSVHSRVNHLISLAIIAHFLAKTLKLGGYIDYGTPVFITFLIVNRIYYKNKLKL